MDIYFCSTYYHALIVVLKRLNNYISDKTIVVITGHVPEGKELAKRLKETGLFTDVIYHENIYPKDAAFSRIIDRNRLVRKVEKEFPLHLFDYKNIYLFMDNIWAARYLKEKHMHYHILEDGLNVFKFIEHSAFAFMVKKDDSLKGKIKRILGLEIKYYLDCEYVDSIEVNEKDGIVLRDDPRIREFPRDRLFEGLTNEDKQIVLKVFSEPSMCFDEPNIAIIFTYPFASDHMSDSMEDQLGMYRKLIQLYEGYSIYIKPHPRDMVDYSALGVHVIGKNFPSEILNFVDSTRIKKYVAIETHCVDVYPKDKVDYYCLSDFSSR